MTPDALARLDHQHLWHPFTPQQAWTSSPPLIIDRGEGNWLIDVEGRRYLDGVASLWTNVHGHRHPELDAALREQLDRLAHSTLLGLSHRPAIELAAELAAAAPPGLTRVFYSDNGSTATEVALKMAFQAQQRWGHPQRTRFATLADAYHGDTLGAVGVGAIPQFHATFGPLLVPALVLPAPREAGGAEEAACLDQALTLLRAQGEHLAGLITEPLVQGAAGMKMHSPDFLRRLWAEARRQGLLVIADEVAVGFGRTGTLWASEAVPEAPDLLCLAKGLGGGYLPIAATLATERIYEAFLGLPEEGRHFFHGHTFTGNPLAAAVARASLRLLRAPGCLDHARSIGDHLRCGLSEGLTGVRGVRSRGLLFGLDLVAPDGSPWPAAFRAGHRAAMAARRHGLILRPLGDTLVINPPLSLTREEADLLLDAVRRALRSLVEEA